MKKLVMLAVVLAVCGGYSPHAPAEGAKVAYVDLQRALLEVDEGKGAKSKLKVYFDDKQSLLDKESERLKKMKEDLDRQEQTLNPEVKSQKEAELQKNFIEVQKLYYTLQNELKQKESEAVQPILEKMQDILKAMAEKDSYDLILDKNSSGIVYAPLKFDLTNDLIRQYDAKYGKGERKDAKDAKEAKPKGKK